MDIEKDFIQRVLCRILTVHLCAGHVQSGQYLWPAAAFMGHYLQKNWDNLKSPRVLELGAGVGLAGILASKLVGTEQVVLSDYDHGSLQLLADNIELNKADNDDCEVTVEFLEWGEKRCSAIPFNNIGTATNGEQQIDAIAENSTKLTSELGNGHAECIDETFPLLLGTDLLYCKEIVEPLLKSAKMLLGSSKTSCFILVSSFDPGEDVAIKIDACCRSMGLIKEVIIELDREENTCRVEHFKHLDTVS